MTQRIVIKNLEELGRFRGLFVPADEAQEVRALVPVVTEPTTDADLEALAHYRRLQSNAARLERVADEGHALANRAANLAHQAFNPDCRRKAEGIATAVVAVATTARQRLAALSAALAALSVRSDVARLPAEEREREEAVRREAEERQREARLREGIARAEALAGDQKFDEALRLLGRLRKDSPSRPDITSSIEKIRRQRWAVKTGQVEQALRQARRMA